MSHKPDGSDVFLAAFLQRLMTSIGSSRYFFASFLIHAGLLLLLGTIVLSQHGRRETGFKSSGAILVAAPPALPSSPPAQPQTAESFEVKAAVLAHPMDRSFRRISAPKLSENFNVPLPDIPAVNEAGHLLAGGLGSNHSDKGVEGGGNEISFFGIRSKGEKVALLVDASASMIFLNRGGIEGYGRVKSELVRVINELSEAHSFNLMVFSDHVFMFSTNGLAQVSMETKKEASKWIEPLCARGFIMPKAGGPISFMGIPAEYHEHRYQPSDPTLPMVGGTRVDLALLAAYEQGVDTIFIISDGEPCVLGWSSKDVLKKVDEWRKRFYEKSSRKAPRIHIVSYEADPTGNAFLQNLARHNKGEFLYIKGFRNNTLPSQRDVTFIDNHNVTPVLLPNKPE